MQALHPKFLEKDGKPEFVVLPYEEYLALQEFLEDAEDLLDLRAAKSQDEGNPSIAHEEVRKLLGL